MGPYDSPLTSDYGGYDEYDYDYDSDAWSGTSGSRVVPSYSPRRAFLQVHSRLGSKSIFV